MTEKLYKPLLIDSITAAEDLTKQRFVDFTGAICKSGEKAYGICDVDTDSGQLAPIAVFGVLLVEAGDTIAVGDSISSDDEGKAVVTADGAEINGYALDEGVSGGTIRILKGN